MKTKILLTILFAFFAIMIYSQPKKETWEIGASGYWMNMKKDGNSKLNIYEINSEANYYILRNLSVGGKLQFKGGKDFTRAFNPSFSQFNFAPIIDGYIINQNKFGISIKGALNIALANSGEDLENKNRISSFQIGPKFSYYLTPNLSTFIWSAYRKMYHDFDSTTGFRIIGPSDNFDIRWGFSYFLQRKEKE